MDASLKQSKSELLVYELAESLCSLVIKEHQILQAELTQIGVLVEDAVQELGGSSRDLSVCVSEHTSLVNEFANDEHISTINNFKQQVNRHTSRMNRSLQFDDIVQQLAGHVSERIELMQQLFSNLESDVASIKLIGLANKSDTLNHMQSMSSNILNCRKLLEKENPVKQTSMSEGRIDLF